MRATIKRDIDTKKLNEIIDDIEVELRSRTLTAVTSMSWVTWCSSAWPRSTRLRTSVLPRFYRDFKDVDEFLQELDKLR